MRLTPSVRWANVVSRSVPPTCRHVLARVRVRLCAPDRKPTPVRLRAFAFDRYPASGETPTNASEREAWVAVDHGVAGASDWIDLGRLEIVRDSKGRTRFCVGWQFDEERRRDPEATTFAVVEFQIVAAPLGSISPTVYLGAKESTRCPET